MQKKGNKYGVHRVIEPQGLMTVPMGMRRGEVLFLQGQKRTGLVGGGNLAAQELGLSMQKKGNKYGVHRVIEPQGLMTQAAKKIDNTMECWSNEILCDVSMPPEPVTGFCILPRSPTMSRIICSVLPRSFSQAS